MNSNILLSASQWGRCPQISSESFLTQTQFVPQLFDCFFTHHIIFSSVSKVIEAEYSCCSSKFISSTILSKSNSVILFNSVLMGAETEMKCKYGRVTHQTVEELTTILGRDNISTNKSEMERYSYD